MSTKFYAHAYISGTTVAVAVAAALTFTPATLAAQSITATPMTVNTGAAITVVVANGPGNFNDWVALVATGDLDSNYIAWQFLNGMTTLPETGVTNATLQFVAPMTPGSYTARLFSNGWTKLATSSPVAVTDDTVPPLPFRRRAQVRQLLARSSSPPQRATTSA